MTLKKIPDLDDPDLMIARGRRSVLMSARNEACEALRDACTSVQSAAIEELPQAALRVIEIAERLQTVGSLWSEL